MNIETTDPGKRPATENQRRATAGLNENGCGFVVTDTNRRSTGVPQTFYCGTVEAALKVVWEANVSRETSMETAKSLLAFRGWLTAAMPGQLHCWGECYPIAAFDLAMVDDDAPFETLWDGDDYELACDVAGVKPWR